MIQGGQGCPATVSCMLPGATLDATSRREVVISPVRVNLVACVLSWWLPADYNPVLRSSWLSPAEHDAGEKWTMSHCPPPPHPAQVHPSSCWRGKETCRMTNEIPAGKLQPDKTIIVTVTSLKNNPFAVLTA